MTRQRDHSCPGASELSRVSTAQEEPIELFITPERNQILFHLDGTDLVSQLIEGNFPTIIRSFPRPQHAYPGRTTNYSRP